VALLRATLAPRPPQPDRDSREPADPARLHDAIQAFRDDPALAAALELASADLARAVSRPAPQNAARSPRQRRRMTLALTGYLLRLRHRATPFGLFAGTALLPVAPAADGTRTGARTAGSPVREAGLTGRLDVLMRPSPRWLAGLVAELEADPALPGQAPRVRIAAAPSVRPAGAWHVLASRESGGPGQWHADAAVRRSPLLDAVLAVAGPDGIGYQALLDLLDAAGPGVGRDQLACYISRLLTARLLVSDLLPAPGDPDPLGHLAGRLDGHPVATRLRASRADLGQASPPSAGEQRRLRAALREVHPRDADLVADTLLGTDLRLPRLVAREVERAASVAWTCSPPRPSRPLAGLHHAMLDRYGSGRPVPLSELLDLTESLGLRSSDGLPPRADPAEEASRDRMLTRLAVDALTAGHAELLLDRPLRHRLGALCGSAGSPPPVDVFAEVVTASAQALDRGDFLVVLGSPGYPAPAGATAGRLAARLGRDAPRLAAPAGDAGSLAGGDAGPLMGEDAGSLAGGDAGSLDVELVFRPPDPAAANLVAGTGWTEFRIDLTRSGRSARDIALADLSVIATPERLRLRSERLGRDVRPVSFSALNPRRAGPVAGLLLALGAHGAVPWRPWDWGDAAVLPWLPRVRTGRAVLAPARWALPPGLLYLAGAGTGRRWRDGLLRWRDAHEVPDVVVAGARDQRLPLDLEDPVHAELLRRECRDRGVVTVTEPPGGLAAWRACGWPSGPGGPHTAEIVLALHPVTRGAREAGVPRGTEERNRGPAGSRETRTGAPDGEAAAPDDEAAAFLPGGPWLCAGLAVPEVLQDGVLAELADEALQAAAGQAEVDRWFFVRGADPAGVPQLRLRFHGHAGGLNQALLPALHAWTGRLRAAGLLREFSLLSYWPERHRYGGGACMAAAERFFHCDSRLSLELLGPGAAAPERLAAPGVLHILTVMLGSRRAVRELPRPRLSAPERRRLAGLGPDHGRPDHGRPEHGRPERDQPPVTVDSHGQGARSAWPEWHVALAAYRSRLGDAGKDPVPVAWSLVHMHCNRLAGPSRATERIAVALARDLAATR
jgi:lantibiotic biosynthesis protein